MCSFISTLMPLGERHRYKPIMAMQNFKNSMILCRSAEETREDHPNSDFRGR